MKLRIRQLHRNPYSSLIDEASPKDEQVDLLINSIRSNGFMGSIPVTLFNGKYTLISHNKRLEALKRIYGSNYHVPVTVHEDYNEPRLLKGLIIENFTQRKLSYEEEVHYILTVRKILNENPNWIIGQPSVQDGTHGLKRDTEGKFKKGGKNLSQGIGARRIEEWLNLRGEVISKSKIANILRMYDRLHEDILKKINKSISYTEAANLSNIDNKDEQIKLYNAITDEYKDNKEQRVKSIALYNSGLINQTTKQRILEKKIRASSMLSDSRKQIKTQGSGHWIFYDLHYVEYRCSKLEKYFDKLRFKDRKRFYQDYYQFDTHQKNKFLGYIRNIKTMLRSYDELCDAALNLTQQKQLDSTAIQKKCVIMEVNKDGKKQ